MSKVRSQGCKLPITEIFQSLEGEGTKAGYPTTFVRMFGCNLNCSWCDTGYSKEPSQPGESLSVFEIVSRVKKYQNRYICLTGGEPLLHGENSLELIQNLVLLEAAVDVHVETNGSVDLEPLARLRKREFWVNRKLRIIMDYKLPASGETARMQPENFDSLLEQDEIKFVIADEADFLAALEVLKKWYFKGQPLFSPVWGCIDPQTLAAWLIKHNLKNAKLSLPLHKLIWGEKPGV